MWTQLVNMTAPAFVGSMVTLCGIYLSAKLKSKKLDIDIEAAQDSVWLELVKQSRIEYALQRKENNRLRYITHHLQEEISQLEKRNAELALEVVALRTQLG